MRFTLALLALGFAMLFAGSPAAGQLTDSCTKTLAAGGDLSTFLGTLTAGDVGCLRQGTYLDGCVLSWGGSGTASAPIKLQSYPGETATLQSQLNLSGSYTTVQNVVRTGAGSGCGTDIDGLKLDGDHNSVLAITVATVPRHGILQGTTSSNSDISRNLIHGTGCTYSTTQVHGIYLKTSGQATRNVIYDVPCGYGIQAYQTPHDLLISGNVTVDNGTGTRGGVVLYCDTNCDLVNHISVGHNTTYGALNWQTCVSGCTVDRILSYGEGSSPIHGTLAASATNVTVADPQFIDSEYRVGASSPAVDAGRSDLAAWPDRDGAVAVSGLAPDLGAYEVGPAAPAPTPTPSPTPTPTPAPVDCQNDLIPSTGLGYTSRTRTSLHLDWDSYDNQAGYRSAWGMRDGYWVEVRNDNGTLRSLLWTSAASDLNVTGLVRNTYYRFRVQTQIDCDQDGTMELAPWSAEYRQRSSS